MLSPDQIKAREGKITGTRARILMNGTALEVMNLWREMIGDPDFVEEDLSNIWAVQLGIGTEALNLSRYAFTTGHSVSRHGEVVVHPKTDWAACTLDGWDDVFDCPIECKHVGGKEPRAKVIERYKPQFHWQMFVCERRRVMLSLIEGAREPEIIPIHIDDEYMAALLHRATLFMNCVSSLTPPVVI